MHVLSQTI